MGEFGRFTTWLSAAERHALEHHAQANGMTVANVIRTAVRQHLGTDALKAAAMELAGETSEEAPAASVVTGNIDE